MCHSQRNSVTPRRGRNFRLLPLSRNSRFSAEFRRIGTRHLVVATSGISSCYFTGKIAKTMLKLQKLKARAIGRERSRLGEM